MPTCRDLQLHPHTNKEKQNMDVRCQSVWAYSNFHGMVLGIQMPTCRDLQLYPHIQQTEQHVIIGKQMPTCRDLQLHPHIQTKQHDHRKANANLQGLTIASSHKQTEAKHGCQMPIYLGLL